MAVDPIALQSRIGSGNAELHDRGANDVVFDERVLRDALAKGLGSRPGR